MNNAATAHNTRGATSSRAINRLERIRLGGTEQWIRVRGKDVANPVLPLIQQGPGAPMLNEAADDNQLWRFEDEFVVVYWDQRACGKSFSRSIPPQSVTLEQMVTDTHELIQALTQRFNIAQVYATGFSIGGTIAALVASRHPELIRAVVCVGLDLQFDVAERVAYEFAMQQATRLGATPRQQDLRHAGQVGDELRRVNRKTTYTQLLLKALRQLAFSRDYSRAEIVGTLRGMRFAQDQLLPDLAKLNLFETLPRLDVPVFLLQGRHDEVSPASVAEQYYQVLQAPKGKQLI